MERFLAFLMLQSRNMFGRKGAEIRLGDLLCEFLLLKMNISLRTL